MLSWIGLGVLILTALTLVLVDDPGGTIGIGNHDFARLMSGVALLIVIGGSMFAGQRGRAGDVFKQAITWLGIALVLVVVYSYRAEFANMGNRVIAELSPGTPRPFPQPGAESREEGVVAIRAGPYGHFEVEALVNGHHVRMLADTGASTVVLTNSDARRIGINPESLQFKTVMNTANGKAFTAHVTLDEVDVGGITVNNVTALVSRPGALGISLLGMSYLKRIKSFELSGPQLILRH